MSPLLVVMIILNPSPLLLVVPPTATPLHAGLGDNLKGISQIIIIII